MLRATAYSRFFVALLLALIAGTIVARQPYEPLDTSSPRTTFASFLAHTEETARHLSEYRDSPNPATQDALWRNGDEALDLLDLSQVPPAARREVGVEAFYLLWEVIARVELPDLNEIPDAPAGKNGDEKAAQLTRWRLPGTRITIARVEEGPRAGEFLFSPYTVERARHFFEATRELPYRRPMPIQNVYRFTQLITGWMIPLAWVEALPGWTNSLVLAQMLWKWLVLVLLFALALVVVLAVYRWVRRKPWDGSLRSYLRRLGTPLAILFLAPLLHYFSKYQINVSGSAVAVPEYLIEIAYGVAMVWAAWLTAGWIAETVIASPRIGARSLDAHLIRLAARAVGLMAVIILVFRVANDVGIPVYGLVAGAGVGGLAVALAAKSTLENFMGTLNLYADRPVRVGDSCRYGEDPSADWQRVGTVEEIGLRSTRIRGLDRTITTIPNAEFSNMHIVNLTKRDRMLLNTTLGLRYETTRDQLRFLLAELRELLHVHPKTIHTADAPIRVRFVGFGDCSLNVAMRVYIKTSSFNELLAINEDILLRVMAVVEQAGTAFAFPSRTLYHTRDGGLDDERRQEGEKQVREWASAQTLPFPDLAEEDRMRITDTLDYPPEGSPGADTE